MAMTRGFNVLVAADGSPASAAAVAAALEFPWPASARAHGVVAGGGPLVVDHPTLVWGELDGLLERVAEDTRRRLVRRWPAAEVAVVRRTPVEAILGQARRVRAAAIVVGSHGYGAVRRLLLGSVSRGVVRRASCAVLVVKGRPRRLQRFVVGVDGSPNAQRAVAFVARLRPRPGSRVTLVTVVETRRLPSLGLMPAAVRSRLAGELAAINAQQVARARRRLAEAAARLKRAGWRVRSVVRVGAGAPLRVLIDAARDAHTLVLGARGMGGLERVLLGSVAEGALSHARLPVLIVR